MIQVKRSEVKPGETFYFNANRIACIALNPSCHAMIKKNYGCSNPNHPLHVFTLTGNISHCFKNSTVYIDEK